jgi:hypothetical protein
MQGQGDQKEIDDADFPGKERWEAMAARIPD